jgi:hypothetical protein
MLELAAILGFGTIAFQDLKERMVHWVLFPIMGLLLAALQLQHISWEFVLFFGLANTALVSGVLLLLFLYTKYIGKKKFLNHSFGLGDVLFMYAFALGFPMVTFIVLFSCSLCFSLLGFVVLNYFVKTETVPLAGFMGIFLGMVLLWNLFTDAFTLYLI